MRSLISILVLLSGATPHFDEEGDAMTVIACELRVPRRGGVSTERKGMLTEIARRRYTKQFQVIVDNILDGPNTILKAFGVPKLGESYILGNDADLLATCVDVNVEPTEHPLVFHLTASYDTSRVVDASWDNPLNIPPEISWSFVVYERPLTRDLLGVPVMNSAGDSYDPPFMTEDIRPVVTVNRNEAEFDPDIARAYANAVNSDVWNGLSPYYAKMNSVGGQRQADMGTRYWRVTYEVEFRKEGHHLPLLDQGYRELKTLRDGRVGLVPVRDSIDNSPLQNPTLLNGRGGRLDTARAKLMNAMSPTINVMQCDADPLKFPPLASMVNPPPPHGYFEVRIDQEVLQVRATAGGNWAVERGHAGTAPAYHDVGADVKLEPYYLNYLPYKTAPFGALRLPLL